MERKTKYTEEKGRGKMPQTKARNITQKQPMMDKQEGREGKYEHDNHQLKN